MFAAIVSVICGIAYKYNWKPHQKWKPFIESSRRTFKLSQLSEDAVKRVSKDEIHADGQAQSYERSFCVLLETGLAHKEHHFEPINSSIEMHGRMREIEEELPQLDPDRPYLGIGSTITRFRASLTRRGSTLTRHWIDPTSSMNRP